MIWLWSGFLVGAIIAFTWTLREHRKMLAYLAQHIQLIERALTEGEK